MIEDENQLRYSLELIVGMYSAQEREAVEPVWTPEMREEMAAQTKHMRLKIEREVAEYLAAKYGYIRQPAERPAVSAMLTEQAA